MTTLGRSGLRVSRLGIGASYGVPAGAIERAFHEFGVNYFYWGSLRRDGMRQAIHHLAPRCRDQFVVALQSYDRTGPLLPFFFERGLRALRIDQADVLILGYHTRMPARRVLDAAERLRQRGLVRHLAISGHRRPFFADCAAMSGQPLDNDQSHVAQRGQRPQPNCGTGVSPVGLTGETPVPQHLRMPRRFTGLVVQRPPAVPPVDGAQQPPAVSLADGGRATSSLDHSQPFDIFMMRYSAAHRGCETEVFPHLPATDRPGVIAYTATRWGDLLNPRRMPPGERPLTAAECYRFTLTNPAVDMCLTGPADARQMDEALSALEAGPMSADELDRARRIGDHVRQTSRIKRQ